MKESSVPMDKEILIAKLLNLAEGRETPESWQEWWNEHEAELESLLNRGDFLKLKPCKHGFKWVPVFTSQKGAVAILEKNGVKCNSSHFYQEQYLEELDAFCKEQKRQQREKQKEFILKERSKEALKQAIRKLLEDRKQFEELSKENLKQIQEWSWPKKCEQFKEFFEKNLE